jgi:hypothetical protein
MGLGNGLRNVLARRRVRTAAPVAAAVLVWAASSAAAAGPAWTKAWAERLLQEHFDAVAVVCLPLGPATRQGGANAFREFVCSVVEQDGSHTTVHLKPRSRTTWTTLGAKAKGGSATTTTSGKPTNDHGHGHDR